MDRKRKTESKKPPGGVIGGDNSDKLSPYEWDFRLVCEDELLTAILYEYTRSCPRVRSIIESWHGQKLNYREMLRLDCTRETRPLLRSLKKVQDATNGQAVEIAFAPDTAGVDADNRSLFLIHLWLVRPEDEASIPGQSIATAFGNLDHPWEQLRAVHGDDYLRTRLFMPSNREGIMGHPGPLHTWDHLKTEHPGVQAERLLIDWSLPIKQLVGSFRRWVQDNHPGIPPENRRPRGRKPQWEYLKWLAAYRFHQSGYNYEKAQVSIQTHIGRAGSNDPHEVLPKYANAAAWGNAVARATSELASDFTRSVNNSFPAMVRE